MADNDTDAPLRQNGILRDSRIVFRMTSDEYDYVRRKATSSGRKISSYVRMKILDEKASPDSSKSGHGESILTPSSVKEMRRNFNDAAKSITRLVNDYGTVLDNAVREGKGKVNETVTLRVLSSVVSNELVMQDSLNRLLALMEESETFVAAKPSGATTAGAVIREMLAAGGTYTRAAEHDGNNTQPNNDMIKATAFGYLSSDPVVEQSPDGSERLHFEIDFSGIRNDGQQLVDKVTVITDKVKLKDSIKRGRLVLAEGTEVITFEDGTASIYIIADRVSVHGVLSGRIEGNLVTAASAFTSKSGVDRIRFRLAAEGETLDGDGRTQYVSVVMHRDDALLALLKKGARVYVEGVQDISVSSSASGSFLNVSVYADEVSVVRPAKGAEE